jgi:DNA-3-methyladenine glycosylase
MTVASTYDFLSGPSWEVAPLLLGWVLETRLEDAITAVELTEVEAYDQTDPASHSFRGETVRTAAMFGPPGHLYVYRSYGIHWCVNIVTGPSGHGAAVLLRGGRPLAGIGKMIERRGRSDHLADGPGKLAQALGLTDADYGRDLTAGDTVRLRPGRRPKASLPGPRVGITRATDAPWRFIAVHPE